MLQLKQCTCGRTKFGTCWSWCLKGGKKVMKHTRTAVPWTHWTTQAWQRKHDRYHKQLYFAHLLHKHHIIPSEGSGRIWHKLNPRIEQTFKRQSEDVEGRKEARAQRAADRLGGLLFSYQSSVEQNWHGQEQISCFSYFHLPLHHAEDTYAHALSYTHKKNAHSKAKQMPERKKQNH